jgi:hypothetical protein
MEVSVTSGWWQELAFGPVRLLGGARRTILVGDFAAKLRITAALLGCASQRDLCSEANETANPLAAFGRSDFGITRYGDHPEDRPVRLSVLDNSPKRRGDGVAVPSGERFDALELGLST